MAVWPYDDRPITLENFPDPVDAASPAKNTIRRRILSYLLDLGFTSCADSVAAGVANILDESADIDVSTQCSLEPADCVYTIFSHITWSARQIPPGHIWQRGLIELLQALQNQPSPPAKVAARVAEIWGGSDEFHWARLPTFRLDVGEHLNAGLVPGAMDWSADSWADFHGFVALLMVSGVAHGDTHLDMANAGFRVFRGALETEQGFEMMSYQLPAATAWIQNAGQWLFEHRGLAFSSWPTRTDSDHYQGENGLSTERWYFWKQRFEQLADDECPSLQVRELARASARHMNTIDGGLGHTDA